MNKSTILTLGWLGLGVLGLTTLPSKTQSIAHNLQSEASAALATAGFGDVVANSDGQSMTLSLKDSGLSPEAAKARLEAAKAAMNKVGGGLFKSGEATGIFSGPVTVTRFETGSAPTTSDSNNSATSSSSASSSVAAVPPVLVKPDIKTPDLNVAPKAKPVATTPTKAKRVNRASAHKAKGRRYASPRSQCARSINSAEITYMPGSARLTRDGQRVVKSLARSIKQCPRVVIEVEGHTDAVGSQRINKALSIARAKAAKTALVKQGVSPKRVVAKGYGKAMPKATNKNPKGRAKNRRVDFKIKG